MRRRFWPFVGNLTTRRQRDTMILGVYSLYLEISPSYSGEIDDKMGENYDARHVSTYEIRQ